MIGRTRLRSRIAASAAAVFLVAVAGCGSDGDGGTQPGQTPAIAISINPASASVAQGGSTEVTGTVTRSGGFTGTVTLAVEGAPAGVTGTVSDVNTSNGTTTGTITVTVASTVAAGAYNLTVRATGSGVDAKTATFALTVTAANAPNYTLALTPTALSLAQGASGTSQVAITRTNFTGEVALAAQGLPAGVTAAFAPATTTDNASTLTLTVGAGVAPGQSTITVRGTATGVDDRTATLTLTVTVAGSYTLSAAPNALSVAQGAQGQATINVDRTGGFAAAVALAVTGQPAGLTATLNPASTTTNASTLTVAAAANLAAGSYPLTITGTTPGLADQTTTVTVTVTQSGGGSSISLDFSACTEKPIWFAYQDGSSAWTQVVGASNVYQFNVGSTTAGIAWVVNNSTGAGGTTVNVSYYTTAQLGGTIDLCGFQPPVGKTISGSVTGVAADLTHVGLGGATTQVAAPGGPFQLQGVASGPQDLLAFRSALTGPSSADRGIIRRDQDIADGGSVGVLDMSGAESFGAATATIGVGGATAGANIFLALGYHTGAACTGISLSSVLPSTATSALLSGIPAAPQRASDYHSATVTAVDGTTSVRSVTEYFHTLADRTIALGAAISPTVTSLGGPYKRLQADFTLAVEYNLSATFGYEEVTGSNAVAIFATGARASGAVSLGLPDFTGVAGWNSAWAPGGGATVGWAATGIGSSVSGSSCQEGARLTLATTTGTN